MTKTKTTDDKAIAIRPPGTGAVAKYDYGQDSGAGFGVMTQDDYQIPFLNLLQALSPELDKTDEKYIPGSSAGMFANTVTGELYDGEKGVIIVPCFRQRVFNEYTPRDAGKGFHGTHDPKSRVVLEALANNRNSAYGLMTLDGKHELNETVELYCLVIPDAEAAEPIGGVLLSLTSSKLKKVKKLITKLDGMAGKPPLFAHRLRLTAVPDEGPKGKFYNVAFQGALGTLEESLLPPGSPLFMLAREFCQRISDGKIVVDRTQADGDATPSDEGVDDVL